MQQPPVFREDRPEVLHELVREQSFATLVACVDAEVSADHLPLVLDVDEAGQARLSGHLAAINPLVRTHAKDPSAELSVLCIFQGPHAYISPSWYASKREHGRAVPTWNYIAVHARGTLRFRREETWLRAHLADLSDANERHRDEPWRLSDAPPDYTERLLRGIVGVEIAVTEMSGVWKMSQNKSDADIDGVVAGLRGEGHSMANAVSDSVTERRR